MSAAWLTGQLGYAPLVAERHAGAQALLRRRQLERDRREKRAEIAAWMAGRAA